MSKTKAKNVIEGKQFYSSSDGKYFLFLKEQQQKEIVEDFQLDYTVETTIQKKSGKEKTVYKLNIEIDGLSFHTKSDADYYLYLKSYQKENLISSFKLDQKKNKEDKAKYLAKKVEIDGFLFDSKAEANYYIHLLEQKKANIIRDFEIKPTYELQPKFKKNGKSFRSIEYTPDFEIYHLNGDVDVIDVKGMVTPDFAIKKKLFEYKYLDKELKLVKYVEKFGGWITFDEWAQRKKEEKKKK